MSMTIVQPKATLDDPHACTDSSDVLSVFRAVFDTLVRRDVSGWAPCLATAWTMSDDARTTTFELRDGVDFHDGDPCDAEAIKFNIERMARPDMGATLGAPGVYAQYLAGVQATALNRTRLRVTTREPLADIFDILGYGHIASPRAIASAGDDLAHRCIGTGPYALLSVVDGAELTAQAAARRVSQPPGHASITWRSVPDPVARAAALADGSAQVANGLPADAEAKLPLDRFALHRYLVPMAVILMFNASAGPGADARVRLALNLAIDRPKLVTDVLAGMGQPLHGYISPIHDGADSAAPPFPLDLVRARALLKDAGFGSGLDLNIYMPTRLPDESFALVDAIATQLAHVGVRFIRHIEPDRVRYANQVRLKQIHDICVFDSSPMSAFRVLVEKIDSRQRGSWWEGYRNPGVETLIDRGRRTIDTRARMAVYRDAYRLLQQDPPWLYVYNHHRCVGLAGRHPAWRMPLDGVLDVRQLPV